MGVNSQVARFNRSETPPRSRGGVLSVEAHSAVHKFLINMIDWQLSPGSLDQRTTASSPMLVRVLSALHMVVYVACACSRLACTLTGMALMLEKRYERGGLPTCSARRPMTKATGCVVRRRGGERASVVEIEGQTREGSE